MKNTFRKAITIFLVLIWGGCTAQFPEKALKEKYPKAKKITWRIDKNGSFEAHFRLNGSEYRSDFTLRGKWIETERSIKWDELPPAVKHTVKQHADKKQIVELEEVHHHKKGWFYDVEIEKKKGKRDLVISPDGQIIDKEEWK